MTDEAPTPRRKHRKKPPVLTDVLVIPDCHVAPGQSVKRFVAAGKLAKELHYKALKGGRKFVVIQMGDFGDFESTSSHAEGPEAMTKHYLKDVAACRKALEAFHEGLDSDGVRLVALEGNHEGPRVDRILNKTPRLQGMMDPMVDIGWAELGWEVYPFREIFKVGEVAFSHYFSSGVMDKAIGGVNMARSMLTKGFVSCVAGHSHIADYATLARSDGKRLTAISSGVFCDNDDPIFDWTKSSHNYWSGLVILRRLHGTDFDTEFMRLDSLMDEHG